MSISYIGFGLRGKNRGLAPLSLMLGEKDLGSSGKGQLPFFTTSTRQGDSELVKGSDSG